MLRRSKNENGTEFPGDPDRRYQMTTSDAVTIPPKRPLRVESRQKAQHIASKLSD